MRPVIAITLDYQVRGSFSDFPHYALRHHYCDRIYEAGGLPVPVPYIEQGVADYLQQVDGVVMPGGDFGLDPGWYGAGEEPAFAPSPRLQFECHFMREALNQGKPVLGICAGMQILAGMHGCGLAVLKKNREETGRALHAQGQRREEYVHRVHIEQGSHLAAIMGGEDLLVNSAHREAVVKLAAGVRVAATSEDGVIEAIEIPAYDFALGVQWHPEFFAGDDQRHFRLFTAVVQQAQKTLLSSS